ncbi:MAG: dihydrofolate reductase [Bdellovibrionota bacterium]
MITSMIAAMGKNRVIGKNNQLMWHLPEEMQYFKDTTLGHHIIMGRKTFDAHPKALPGRTSVIITQDPHYVTPPKCIAKDSIASALDLPKKMAKPKLLSLVAPKSMLKPSTWSTAFI